MPETQSILILRDSESANYSIDEVSDWIRSYGVSYQFLTGYSIYKNGNRMSIAIDPEMSSEPKVSIDSFDNNLVRSVWFRGFIRYRRFTEPILKRLLSANDNISELKYRINLECSKINAAIFKSFEGAYQLPQITSLKLDKFRTLQMAASHGLCIPKSIIINNRKDLHKFYEESKYSIITKSLYETVYFVDENELYTFKTAILDGATIEKLPEFFYPSLFQEYIPKQYEIRSFYLERTFYSMAIFSQNDEQTMVDFRRYNDEQPNRVVPYELPKKIMSKIENLMRDLKLNTGSLDLIKKPSGEYIFLEVNPVGQFGMVSKPCNYYLEDEIAKSLIKNMNNGEA